MRLLAAGALTGTLLLTSVEALRGQVSPPPPPTTDSVDVVPGIEYAINPFTESMLGRGYRPLWTTSIRVPVVDLDEIGGGLTPIRLGGGTSTRTLHLDGADGRRYVFRSVNKTPVDLLAELGGSAVAGIIRDQMSSFHPSGAIIVSRLLDEVGILHPDPTFMVIPDDPRLGDFREDFAGLLVLVEERPDDGPDGTAGFAGSTRIVQTDDLFEEIEDDSDEHVDAEELLRARLIDLLVGDRDRSHNNHLWARFDREGGGHTWRVVPRDRDQSFVRYDGRLMGIARRYERRLVTFEESYPDIAALTRNAWDIDRTLLVSLDRTTWDEVVTDVQARITDEVIREAVERMPPEHVALMGEEISSFLMARRDRLREAADVFYGIVFGYADIHLTDDDEVLEVTRSPNGSVRLSATAGQSRRPTYDRSFDPDETSEIRVYLHGGDDVTRLSGTGEGGILLRVIGGGGSDRFETATAEAGRKTVLYDDGDATTFPTTGHARVERKDPPRPYSWWFDTGRTLDWGTLTKPAPKASYDPDRGLVLQPGLRHVRYSFFRLPHSQLIEANAGWAFGPDKPIISYRHVLQDVKGPLDIEGRFNWSGVEMLNFFGYGNEGLGETSRGFYRTRHEEWSAGVSFGVGDGDRSFIAAGPRIVHTATDTTGSSTLLALEDPYGSGSFTQAGLGLVYALDARDLVGTPTRGVRLEGGAGYYPGILDATRGAFGYANAQFVTYLSPPGRNPVLALRAAGKRVWGPYPVTQAAYLGGSTTLRGLREQRLGGDASALISAEVRVQVATVLFPLPSKVGVLFLTDTGRVYLEEAPSERWHSAAGGGIWASMVNGTAVVRLTAARTDGVTRFYAGMGFAY